MHIYEQKLMHTDTQLDSAIPSPAAIKERACPGDKTTSSFMPSTYVPYEG